MDTTAFIGLWLPSKSWIPGVGPTRTFPLDTYLFLDPRILHRTHANWCGCLRIVRTFCP